MQRMLFLLLLLFVLLSTGNGFGQEAKIIDISNAFTSTIAGTPRVVQDPTKDYWIVAWHQGTAIKARIVKEDGSMTPPKNLATGASSEEQSFDLALNTQNGSSYLLAFENSAGLQVRSVSSLHPGVTRLIESGANGSIPRLVFASGRYFLFWLGTQDGTRSALRVRTLNEDGTPSGTTQTLASVPSGQTFGSLNVGLKPNGSMTAIMLQQSGSDGSIVKVNISSSGTRQGSVTPFQTSKAGLNTIGDIDFSNQGIGFGLWIDQDSVKTRKVNAAGGFGGGAKSISGDALVGVPTQAGISYDPHEKRFHGVWTSGDAILLAHLDATNGTSDEDPDLFAMSTLAWARNANISTNSEGKTLVVWEDSEVKPGVAGSQKFRIRGGIESSEEGGKGGPTTVNITIGDNYYSPKSITVTEGSTVTWTNKGLNPHTVTAGTPGEPEGPVLFDQDGITNGLSFSFTFTQKGKYPYWCENHNETGMVTVK